ncbi:MAG: hypothetical protein DMF84_14575 [Acidobacteria bacterium]|nr:MAG: hypothetical protein DMF84_14575 [Acidobacteriota bacterium]
MASGERRDYLERAAGAFEPVSEMLDSGRCEPLKAAVHGVLLVTVSVCAAYNAAAWLKRRQSHLAINAIIYSAAVWWERCHIARHLAACPAVEPKASPQDDLSDAA